MDALKPDDALKFEEHLLLCDHCRKELHNGREMSRLLRKQRPRLQEYYRQHAADFDAEVRLLSRESAGQSWIDKLQTFGDILWDWVTGKTIRMALVPAMALAIAVVLFNTGRSPQLTESLLKSLPSHAIPYHELMVRGGTTADSALGSIMMLNENKNYTEAAKSLKQHVKIFPENADGWMYLGSAQYVLGDFENSTVSFGTAQRLATGSVSNPNIALYYAAALIQNNKRDSARFILQNLTTTSDKIIARQAQAILKQLGPP
jgi:cytochrome c-type biogenesis protein CcmH/NrfG